MKIVKYLELLIGSNRANRVISPALAYPQPFPRDQKMPHQPASSVLQDVKVLDLTRVRSGPTAVRQLADWGADVIKIEQPVALEADGALGAARDTSDFQNLQRNKRSLTSVSYTHLTLPTILRV